MTYISDVLYWISTGLLVPVVLVLIFLFVRALVLLGAFFGRYQAMRRDEALLRRPLENLTPENLDDFEKLLPSNSTDPTVGYMQRLFEARRSPARIEHILSDVEIASDKELSLSVTLAKMGPTVGLMGTLIPMGPALVGLAAGDIASMAYNMQVAFATTVVGLFASAIGFLTKQTTQRWQMRRMSDLELVASLLIENNKKDTQPCDAAE
ncbi:MAG: MotA/TolQ/ExbB proton channel family protein [Paramuribaculum sp.]|nr:MotA/TolQ/ExbB proton channel family protein [Bacteroides sp.]MDE7460990.1 MotA/TolQ/ExbB proton channel family protein [Paramuribaculum sp.]